MLQLTKKERETMLILFKNIYDFYNANSISKVLGISHVGAQKILKRLLKENLLINRQIGKSIIYKLMLDEDYVCKLMTFLLADEANNFKMWIEEFKELYKENRIIILFGSILKNPAQARDIDMMLVIKKQEFRQAYGIIKKRQEIFPKNIHSIELTEDDLLRNIKNKNQATLDIIKNGVILYGQELYVKIIKNVTSL